MHVPDACTYGVWNRVRTHDKDINMAGAAFEHDSLFTDQDEPSLSPIDQLRSQWDQQPGFPLMKQKHVIDSNPTLLPYVGSAGLSGWSWPYAFATQGLLVVAIFASLFYWYLTHDAGPVHELDGGGYLRPRRIEHRHQPEQAQILLNIRTLTGNGGVQS